MKSFGVAIIMGLMLLYTWYVQKENIERGEEMDRAYQERIEAEDALDRANEAEAERQKNDSMMMEGGTHVMPDGTTMNHSM